MILGISGKSQAGKDTIGSYLVKEHGFYRVASADALKRIARNIFGWDSVKDEKGRKFLQDLGCAVRGYNENFWIDQTLWDIVRQQRACESMNFVITDVRFLNEAAILKEKGVLLWRVERQGVPILDHQSETELDSYADFDLRLDNSGTIQDLEAKVHEALCLLNNKPA